MAISWGGFTNHLRVGIEVIIPAYNTYTPNIDVSVRVYVQCDSTWSFSDSQTLTLSGSLGGSWTFQNNLGPNESLHVGTAILPDRAQSYSGGPTYTFTGALSGVYLGAGPSHSINYTLPARPKRAPSAPGAPAYSSLTATSVSAAWAAATDNGGATIDNYTIHVATDSGFATIVKDLPANSLSRAITGLTPGKKYWARSFAHNAIGWSAASAATTFTTPTRAASAPGAPAFSNVTPTGFTAAWADSADYGGASPTAYRLQVATDSGFATVVHDSQQLDRSRSVAGLAPGKKHYSRVLTINNAGSSPWSATTSVDTAIRVASAPGKPTFSSVTATAMTVSWADSADYGGSTPTAYRLQVSTDAGFANLVADSSANNRSRSVTGLTPGQTYYVRVLAVNAAGSSLWSASSSTGTDIRVATAPGTPAWSGVTPTTGTLAWADSADYGGTPPTGYRLQISSNSGFTAVVHDSTALNRTRSVSGLAPGTPYYARVLTVNAAGSSLWSGTTPATTAAFVTGGIEVTGIGPDAATVTWAEPTSDTPTGYQLQYATNADFTADLQTATSATWDTSRTLTGLVPATTYWVRVRSSTASGYGEWSAAVSFQTLSGAKVRQGGAWVESVAYVRQGGQWVIAKVYKRQDGAWVL